MTRAPCRSAPPAHTLPQPSAGSSCEGPLERGCTPPIGKCSLCGAWPWHWRSLWQPAWRRRGPDENGEGWKAVSYGNSSSVWIIQIIIPVRCMPASCLALLVLQPRQAFWLPSRCRQWGINSAQWKTCATRRTQWSGNYLIKQEVLHAGIRFHAYHIKETNPQIFKFILQNQTGTLPILYKVKMNFLLRFCIKGK